LVSGRNGRPFISCFSISTGTIGHCSGLGSPFAELGVDLVNPTYFRNAVSAMGPQIAFLGPKHVKDGPCREFDMDQSGIDSPRQNSRRKSLTKHKEDIMSAISKTVSKKAGLICASAAAAMLFCATPISVKTSSVSGIALSVDQARAEIGRPATPGSVAGVHRRAERRAVRRCAVGVTC
jgi:hypothetical protein